METRRIGALRVSVVGLGCNMLGGWLDESSSEAVVQAALDAGITFFDTADVYGGTRSEVCLGRALGPHRDEAVIATKFGFPIGDAEHRGSADAVRRACEDSLRRLATDRIDLYQMHVPDPTTPINETLDALDDLVRRGLVREIGCSNFSSQAIVDAADVSRTRGLATFASVQNKYNLLQRDAEHDGVLELCARSGPAFVPYFPLANGLLTGKYRRGEPPPRGTRFARTPPTRHDPPLSDEVFDQVEALDAWAHDRGRSLLELAVAWLLAHAPVVSVIAGATRPEQVRANAAAAGWSLTLDDLAEIDTMLRHATRAR